MQFNRGKWLFFICKTIEVLKKLSDYRFRKSLIGRIGLVLRGENGTFPRFATYILVIWNFLINVK